MRLSTLAVAALGAVAGYAGARMLLDRDDLPAQLPDSARRRLAGIQARLHRARGAAADVMADVDRVTADASRELTEDYLRRTGRNGGAPPH